MLCFGCSSPLKPLPTDIPSLKTLAKRGDAWAQFNLGSRYSLGQGVVKNEKEAAKWLLMAAEQGDPIAQHTLGVMYENGQGVVLNEKEAIKWFQMGAEPRRSLQLVQQGNSTRSYPELFAVGMDVFSRPRSEKG